MPELNQSARASVGLDSSTRIPDHHIPPARRAVTRRALSPEDCLELLEMLGLDRVGDAERLVGGER